MGAKTLSKQMNVTEEDALEFIETFYNKYTSIKGYIKKVVEKCKENEYVETIMGRRRYLPNINHQSPAIKSKKINILRCDDRFLSYCNKKLSVN